MTPEALEERIEEVHALNASLDDFEVLAGSEVNILPDGSLDYDDELLAKLDWVIASVHTSFSMGEEEMTDRMIRAIEHPLVDAIGHPTGRKIETRPPYGLDIERVIEAAARTGTMIEINASPDRRDLNELHARAAAQAGVGVLVNTDAHSVRNFDLLQYGIATARRAWLTPEQVPNTRPWAEFAPLRKRAKSVGVRRAARSASPPAPTGSLPRSQRLALGELVEAGDVLAQRLLGQARQDRPEPHQRDQPARAGDDAAAALDPAHDRLGRRAHRVGLRERAREHRAHARAELGAVGAADHLGVDPREVGDADVDAEAPASPRAARARGSRRPTSPRRRRRARPAGGSPPSRRPAGCSRGAR